MAQDWYVVRAGKELGPFTAQQLRDMAATRKLAPDDLVRRSDMTEPRSASSIKGLFPEPAAVPVAAKAIAKPAKAEQSADEPREPRLDATPAQTLPQSLLALLNSKKRVFGLSMGGVGLVVVLMCCGGLGVVGILGNRLRDAAQTELAEADAQWDKGDKAAATGKYRKLLDHPHLLNEQDRPRVYGRAIDGDYERGDAAAGKALIDRADREGVVPVVNHPDANAVVAAIQAERARVEAEKAEKKRQAEAKKKDEERLAKMTAQDRLKEAKWDDVVSAQTLYNEYNSNEVAAADKYGEKTIKVEGEVEAVERGGFGSSNKIMLRGRTGYAVRCAVSGGGDELKKLRAGSWVRIEGRCDGKAPSGVVEMSRCIFVLVNR